MSADSKAVFLSYPPSPSLRRGYAEHVAVSETNRAVFLSYASQDAEAARKICDALRAAGVEVWFDRSELRRRRRVGPEDSRSAQAHRARSP